MVNPDITREILREVLFREGKPDSDRLMNHKGFSFLCVIRKSCW